MAGPELLIPLMVGAAGAGAARLMSGSGGGGPNINVPAAPPPILPASQPAQAKPKATGMQQSFLSGAAQSQLPGQVGASASGAGGKTLLGA